MIPAVFAGIWFVYGRRDVGSPFVRIIIILQLCSASDGCCESEISEGAYSKYLRSPRGISSDPSSAAGMPQQSTVGGNGLLDLLFCGFVHNQNPPYPKKQAADESF
jgi:hypothetical protein